MSDKTLFETRLKNIQNSIYQPAIIDVMDTFETVVLGLKSCKVQFHASDAVALTQIILERTTETESPKDFNN